jgi:hypothetical protein
LSTNERRTAPRYPIQLGLSFRLIQRNLTVDEGKARSLDISSRGIFMEVNRTFPTGALLELSLDWPLLRDGMYPLELRITGRVIRSNGRGTAVRALSHDACVFRVKQPPESNPLPDSKPH